MTVNLNQTAPEFVRKLQVPGELPKVDSMTDLSRVHYIRMWLRKLLGGHAGDEVAFNAYHDGRVSADFALHEIEEAMALLGVSEDGEELSGEGTTMDHNGRRYQVWMANQSGDSSHGICVVQRGPVGRDASIRGVQAGRFIKDQSGLYRLVDGGVLRADGSLAALGHVDDPSTYALEECGIFLGEPSSTGSQPWHIGNAMAMNGGKARVEFGAFSVPGKDDQFFLGRRLTDAHRLGGAPQDQGDFYDLERPHMTARQVTKTPAAPTTT